MQSSHISVIDTSKLYVFSYQLNALEDLNNVNNTFLKTCNERYFIFRLHGENKYSTTMIC